MTTVDALTSRASSVADRDSTPATDPLDRPAVLFVDDEEGVLAGLRTSLRRLRREYDFHFALGGSEALALLDSTSIDVVVSDVRMPGMNGVELLKRIKSSHPGVIRYVLSGEASRSLVMQAIPVAHRWLTKPCSQDDLLAAVRDAMRHRSLMANDEIAKVIGGLDSLPTPPPLYGELLTLLDDPEADLDQIAEVIATDPAVSAKLLQWANSAFGGGQAVADIRSAVVRLGMNMVSYLVLSAEMVDLLDADHAVPGMGLNDLRRHVSSLSVMASSLANPEEQLVAGTAAGLTQVGLLLEASHMPDRISRSYDYAQETGTTLTVAERQLFGVTHVELAGHLLSMWGLPSQLVLAVESAYDMPPARPAPLSPLDAVRAARLATQRLPYFASFGRPHHDSLSPDLDDAVNVWLGALADDGSR